MKISLKQAEYWSSFQVICTLQRLKGINCNLEVLREGIRTMPGIINEIKKEIYEFFKSRAVFLQDKFNLDSPTQLAEALKLLQYILPKTPKGKDGTSSKWMKQFPKDELLSKIVDYRSGKKIYRDFFLKLMNNFKYTDPDVDVSIAKYARCYPEYKLFGAKRTGRFSNSGPNIQQIPKRHPKWGKLCRSIFCLDNQDKTWYHLDWSGQELRLQIHYAKLINATGADKIVKDLQQNPEMDMHKWTYGQMSQKPWREVTKSEKEFVKPINLGLSYGMQSAALCRAIGKPVEKQIHPESGKEYFVAGKEGQEVLNRHKKAVPYVYELIELCKVKIDNPDGIDLRKKGQIITLGGRVLRKDKSKGTYVGLNLLIQGCMEGNTSILTDLGLFPIKNLMNSTPMIWDGKEWSETKCIYSGKKKLVVIKFKNGSELKCSEDHPLLMFDTDKIRRWRKVKEIKNTLTNKQYVCRSETWKNNNKVFIPEFEANQNSVKNNFPSNWRKNSLNDINDMFDLGLILGRLASNGNINKDKEIRFIIADHEQNILDTLIPLFNKLGKFHVYKSKISKISSYNFYCTNLAKQCNWLKLKEQIPPICWQNDYLMRGYLSGLFDGDGTVTKVGTIINTWGQGAIKHRWAKEVHMALLYLGIASRVRNYPKDRTVVQVRTSEQLKFKYLIGFINKIKQDKIKGNISTIREAERIKSIEYTEDFVDMYDLIDCKNEQFAANGYIVHNSGADMMYTAMKRAHEAGIDVKCIVHDEFNIEGTLEDVIKMKEIMENTYKLHVPMVVEVESGKDWGNLSKLIFGKVNVLSFNLESDSKLKDNTGDKYE